MKCEWCGGEIPADDFFITVERKGPSRPFCSSACATDYLEDE